MRKVVLMEFAHVMVQDAHAQEIAIVKVAHAQVDIAFQHALKAANLVKMVGNAAKAYLAMKQINQNMNVKLALIMIGTVLLIVIAVLTFVLMALVHAIRKVAYAKLIVIAQVVFVLFKVVKQLVFVLVIQKAVNA